MKTIQPGRAIQSALRIVSALALAALLGAGCGKAEKPEPQETEEAEAAEAPDADEAEKWEPETAKPAAAPSDHGHDHGPGTHQH